MQTRQPAATSTNAPNSIHKGGSPKNPKIQPTTMSAEFADMFALLPDAEPLAPVHPRPLSQQILVVRTANIAGKRLPPARRPVRRRGEWMLPFRLRRAGAALGLVVIAWSAISLGRGASGPERLAVNPVAGELWFEEQPAAGATVFLHPQNPAIPVRPRATVNADGTFEVTTYEPGDGAPAGRYKATIEWRRPIPGQTGDEGVPPNAVPAAYASPQSTPLEVTVADGDNALSRINIQNQPGLPFAGN